MAAEPANPVTMRCVKLLNFESGVLTMAVEVLRTVF